jgi:ketosteroid isomerase-like protein
MTQKFVTAFNSKRVDIILRLYADDAVIVIDSDRHSLSGKDNIRNLFSSILRFCDSIQAKDTLCMAHKDLAILHTNVDLRLGPEIISTQKMGALIRREPNGHWLYAGATIPWTKVMLGEPAFLAGHHARTSHDATHPRA